MWSFAGILGEVNNTLGIETEKFILGAMWQQ